MTKSLEQYGRYRYSIPIVYDLIHTCGHYGSTVNRARVPGKAADAQRQKAQDCRPCRRGRPQDGRRARNERVELV